MAEVTQLDMDRKLLVELHTVLKAKCERVVNIQKGLDGLKKKIAANMDKGLWDLAQDDLLQARKLWVDMTNAANDADQAQSRVDTLGAAVKRAEERERIAAAAPKYQPYQPEPVQAPADAKPAS